MLLLSVTLPITKEMMIKVMIRMIRMAMIMMIKMTMRMMIMKFGVAATGPLCQQLHQVSRQ